MKIENEVGIEKKQQQKEHENDHISLHNLKHAQSLFFICMAEPVMTMPQPTDIVQNWQ